MSTRGAQHPRSFFAGPPPSRRRPLPPESLAPAPALRAPALRAPRRRLGGRPASPDGMPAAMLPYACVLVLLGGKRHGSPTASLPEVGKEGARHQSPAGPRGLQQGPVHRVCDAVSCALFSRLARPAPAAPLASFWALLEAASPRQGRAPSPARLAGPDLQTLGVASWAGLPRRSGGPQAHRDPHGKVHMAGRSDGAAGSHLAHRILWVLRALVLQQRWRRS